MLIISVEDDENNRWKRKEKKTKTERNKGVMQAIVKVWQLDNYFGFKLGFFELICEDSSFFKSNIELALSIILKQRELDKSKHTEVERMMFKNVRLAILFDMFLNPSFKITTSFANVAWTTASTIKFIYYERFQIIMYFVFIMKIILNFECIES